MYIKKSERQLFKELDDNLKIPARFYSYVDKLKVNHKLIIKSRKGYHCDNCNFDFNLKQVKKANEKYNCPSCKKELIIKTDKCCRFEQKDQFAILDRYKNHYVVRGFELITWYSNRKYESHVCEYTRQIYDEYLNELYIIYNGNISSTISGKFIVHKSFLNNEWKVNRSWYRTISDVFILYHYNIKKLLSNTKWKYSQLWNFAKHYDYFSVINTLKSTNEAFELLTKLKLYELAIDSTDRHEMKTIKSLYPFIKKHLKFMQKYNLDIDELLTFIYLNKEDIKIIKKYRYFDFRNKEEFPIDLYKLDKLTNINRDNYYEYIDYLRMCKKLKFNIKDKNILYPKNIEQEHDKLVKLIEIKQNEKFNKVISKRAKKLTKNIYADDNFIIFPTKSVEELIDESNQQCNCVKTYAERIVDGECDIYFMRFANDQKHSLVTIEVKNNKVVQKRTKYNKNTTKEQNKFIEFWERRILNEAT